jgi:hypothetical protein
VESRNEALSQTIPWRVFLRDPEQRVSLIDGIVTHARAGDILMVDRAVVAILDRVGLPRGRQVRGPIVEPVGRGWAGRKAPDCRLLIDTETFRALDGVVRADSLLKTWLHESIHGRRPYASGFAEEWRLHRGFEEGLAEGLARSIAAELDLNPVLASYSLYVAAYRSLAAALDVPVYQIWRRLWELAAGGVATRFMAGIEDVIARHDGHPLTPFQRVRLFARARTMFATSNSVQSPDEDTLLRDWREVLR